MESEATSHRRDIEDWLRFIRAQSHILHEQPQLLFQQAANQPDDSCVTVAAKSRWASASEKRPWLAWINKPQIPDPCKLTLSGHSESVTACAFSPDGKRIISGSTYDGELRAWEMASGAEIAKLDVGKIESLGFCPDGSRFATANEQEIRVWDAETFTHVATLPGSSCFSFPDRCRVIAAQEGRLVRWDLETGAESGHLELGKVRPVAYSRDGQRFVCVKGGSLSVKEVETGAEIATVAGSFDPERHFAYSPDGRLILCTETGGFQITDIATGRIASGYETPGEGWITTLTFSADSRRVITGSVHGTLTIWDAETAEELGAIRAHREAVYACAYSPDDQWIVTGSLDNTLKVWDAQPMQLITLLAGHLDSITACAYSPDGQWIVSASEDKTLKVWDAASGREITNLKGHTLPVRGCAFSPNGRRILSVAGEFMNTGELKIWDTRTWRCTTIKDEFDFDWDPATACAYSPSGRQFMAGFEHGWLKVWQAGSRNQVADVNAHLGDIVACVYSPNGKRLISASSLENELKVWDTKSWMEVGTLAGHTSGARCCSFSPDGRLIVSGSEDSTLKLWNIRTLKEVVTLEGHTDAVTACAFSSDGRWIVSGSEFDNTIRLWDARTYKTVIELKDVAVRTCGFLPDSRRVFASDGKNLKLWNVPSLQETAERSKHSREITALAISPDHRQVVSGSANNTLKLWNAVTGVEQATLDHHINDVTSCAYSPDGRFVVSGAKDGILMVWNAKTGEPVTHLPHHEGEVTTCAYSPDGRRIVSGGWGETLKLWNADTWEEVATLRGYEREQGFLKYDPQWQRFEEAEREGKQVTVCTFSPDGRHIAAGSKRGTLILWDAKTHTQLATMTSQHYDRVTSCAYASDGRRIVSNIDEETLIVWDGDTGRRIFSLKGHTEGGINNCAYSPDGRRIVSAAADGTLRVWNALTGKEVAKLAKHEEGVNACLYSPDGRRIVSVVENVLTIRNAETGVQIATLMTEEWIPEVGVGGAGGLVVAGEWSGRVWILRLIEHEPPPPLITLVHLYNFNRERWDNRATAKCEWCGRRFVPTSTVLDSIRSITRNASLSADDSPCAQLPINAWDESRLASDCPHCDQPLRFNPFIVDNRGRY